MGVIEEEQKIERRKRASAWAIGATVVGLAAVIGILVVYLWNPSGTASYDPNARLYGTIFVPVATDHMKPTIGRGALLIVNTWAYRSSGPEVGDIIIYYPSAKTSITESMLVARVVAAEESTVELRDGVLVVDGREVEERYLEDAEFPELPDADFAPLRLEKGSYFALGDNRPMLEYAAARPVPRERVVGKVRSWTFGN